MLYNACLGVWLNTARAALEQVGQNGPSNNCVKITSLLLPRFEVNFC